MLRIRECLSECVDVIVDVIGGVMERYHIPYISSCINQRVCRGLIAYLNNDVAGVGVYYSVNSSPKNVGVIYYVAVKVNYRGLGVGKSLIASMEELLQLSNTHIYLATTRYDNKVVRGILSKLGYSEMELKSLGQLSEVVRKLTCGYDDDLLYIKFQNAIPEIIKSSELEFLTIPSNLNLINKLWRSICYDVWLSRR